MYGDFVKIDENYHNKKEKYYNNSINYMIRTLSFLLILFVGISPIIQYALNYFLPEYIEKIDNIARITIPICKLVAIISLFMLVSHKSVYWVLLILLIPIGLSCIESGIQPFPKAIITVITYMYALSILFMNNFEEYSLNYDSVSEDFNWNSYTHHTNNCKVLLFPIFTIISILMLIPFAAHIPYLGEMWSPNHYICFKESWFYKISMVIMQIFFFLSIKEVIFSWTFSGELPQKGKKARYTPFNKFFIGGILTIIFGICALIIILSFHDQLILPYKPVGTSFEQTIE